MGAGFKRGEDRRGEEEEKIDRKRRVWDKDARSSVFALLVGMCIKYIEIYG